MPFLILPWCGSPPCHPLPLDILSRLLVFFNEALNSSNHLKSVDWHGKSQQDIWILLNLTQHGISETLYPSKIFPFFWRILRRHQAWRNRSSLQGTLSLLHNLLPVGFTWKTSKGWPQGGLIKCLHHHSYLWHKVVALLWAPHHVSDWANLRRKCISSSEGSLPTTRRHKWGLENGWSIKNVIFRVGLLLTMMLPTHHADPLSYNP